MKKHSLIFTAALALAGCGNSNNGNGNHDMSVGGNGDGGAGDDMTPSGDMVDVTPIPAPTATHVSATGVTCCLVTAGNAVAYLLTPTAAAGGELHVATSDGTDKMIAAGVQVGGYALSPDGKALFFEGAATADGTFPLSYVDLTAAAPAPKSLFTRGLGGPLTQIAFFSPSGKYFALGVLPAMVSVSADFHVIQVSTGTDVYDRLNGEFDYFEVMLPDDTLIFQDTAGGTGSPPTTPVQTLYWVSLPNAGTAPAAAINTRTAAITPTADNKNVVYQRTNGDLYVWSLETKSGAGTKIASNTVKFVVGFDANGPVAYLGADGSVHVVGLDGTAILDVAAATAGADVLGQITLAPDGGDVYYWQNTETQDNRGTLMRLQVMSGAAPSKVGVKISTADLNVTDTALVFLQNVDDLGQFGDAVKTDRDGTNLVALGMKSPVGGLRVVNPGPNTWFAMHLTGAAADAVNVAIDGSPSLTGGLAWADYLGGAELALDATVHAGSFAFSDDGRDAAFVTGAAYDATSLNWIGSLAFLATRAPSTKIDGKLTGVSELGPISNRTLFVNAPKATTAGVYYVTY